MNGNPWEEDAMARETAGSGGAAHTGDERSALPPDPHDSAAPTDPAAPSGDASDFKLGQRVWGPILRLTEDHAVVSLSEQGVVEGTLDLIHLRDEFGNLGVAEGDEVQAFIVRLAPAIILAPSLYPPATEVLRKMREAMDRQEPVRGRVTAVNRGGLEVQIDGRRAFCPFSQIEIGRCENAEIYLNRLLDFQVTEIDEEKKRVILSRRPLLEKERREKLGDLHTQIKAGVEFDGVVRRVQPFGAFVDIGGVEGLVHVSEISHDRVENPEEVLRPGEKVRVRVLDVSQGKDGKERIKLSIRATMIDPWTKANELFHQGDIVTGKVMRVTEFGAFVKLNPGIEGLLHVSQYKPRIPRGAEAEATEAAPQADAPVEQVPEAGQELTVRITRIELDRKRISLALRDEERGSERADHGAVIGESVEGVVRSVKRFGVFVDLPSLGPWVSGLLPASETGLGREVNLARKFRLGEKLQVEIIEIDERGRIRLSQKRTLEGAEAPQAALDARKAVAPPAGGLTLFAQAFKRAEKKLDPKRGDDAADKAGEGETR
ncbi:MAG: S1 RNA-binding domain-containing protein [Candidatus Eisenbacteria bacterium]